MRAYVYSFERLLRLFGCYVYVCLACIYIMNSLRLFRFSACRVYVYVYVCLCLLGGLEGRVSLWRHDDVDTQSPAILLWSIYQGLGFDFNIIHIALEPKHPYI